MKAQKIVDIKSDGKWVELWFANGNLNPARYDECCKWYMLQDVISKAGLATHVMKHGYLGIWLAWKGDRPRIAGTCISDLRPEE